MKWWPLTCVNYWIHHKVYVKFLSFARNSCEVTSLALSPVQHIFKCRYETIRTVCFHNKHTKNIFLNVIHTFFEKLLLNLNKNWSWSLHKYCEQLKFICVCNGIEDEFHCILKCPLYSYINKISMFNLYIYICFVPHVWVIWFLGEKKILKNWINLKKLSKLSYVRVGRNFTVK